MLSMRRRRGSGLRRCTLALVLASAASWSAVHAQEEPATVGSARVQAFLEQVQTLAADFQQTLLDVDGQPVQEARGTLLMKRPGRFRWDYSEPYEQTIVADGERLWMYDRDLEQVTVKTLDESLASTPAMLLAGSSDITSGYDLRESYRAEGIEWVVLAPRQQETDFQEVRLGFEGDDLRVMWLRDSLDQLTRIEFSNVQHNPSVDETRFAFTPPPGTDVIGDVGQPGASHTVSEGRAP